MDIKSSKHSITSQKAKKLLGQFKLEVNDDLNTPKALATAWDVLRSELSSEEKYGLMLTLSSRFNQ